MSVEPTWHVVAQDALIEEMVAWHGAAPARGEARAYFLAILSALAAVGCAVVPVATLGVQPDTDAPGVYVRFQRMEEAAAFTRAMLAAAAQEPEA